MEVWLLFSGYISLSGALRIKTLFISCLASPKPRNVTFLVQIYGMAKKPLCMEPCRHDISGIDLSMQHNRMHHFTDKTFQQLVSRQR